MLDGIGDDHGQAGRIQFTVVLGKGPAVLGRTSERSDQPLGDAGGTHRLRLPVPVEFGSQSRQPVRGDERIAADLTVEGTSEDLVVAESVEISNAGRRCTKHAHEAGAIFVLVPSRKQQRRTVDALACRGEVGVSGHECNRLGDRPGVERESSLIVPVGPERNQVLTDQGGQGEALSLGHLVDHLGRERTDQAGSGHVGDRKNEQTDAGLGDSLAKALLGPLTKGGVEVVFHADPRGRAQ